MKLVGLTHIGKVRSTNEDSVLVHESSPCYVLVADGMGGHAAGEVASSIAAQAIQEHLASKSTRLDADELVEAVQYANRCIMREMNSHPEYVGMGTTMTLAHLEPDIVTVAHVGDSSAFLRRDGILRKITKDHTYVQRLIDSGQLKRTAAINSRFRNVITRALGMPDVQVDLYREPWAVGDSILLCSDGLTTYADPPYLLNELASGRCIEEQAERLLNFALMRGGKDNISIIVGYNTPEEDPAG